MMYDTTADEYEDVWHLDCQQIYMARKSGNGTKFGGKIFWGRNPLVTKNI